MSNSETVLVARNGDPTDPAFWRDMLPQDDEGRKRFAKGFAEIVLRKRDPNTGCVGSSSSASRRHRQPKRR